MKLKRGDLVIVDCDDIEHIYGWKTWRKAVGTKPSRYTFVGYVLKHTKRFVTIAGAVSSHGTVACVYRLPIGRRTHINRLVQEVKQ